MLSFHLSLDLSTRSEKSVAVLYRRLNPYTSIGLSAHSPVMPSWPQVRMFFSGPRAQSGRQEVPSQPPGRCAPKAPSSCCIDIPENGLALLTMIPYVLIQPVTLYEPVRAVIS